MRIFLAAPDSSAGYLDLSKHDNYLISYYYMNSDKKVQDFIQHAPDASILIDSGAFSAWKKNESIKIDQYISFIKSNEKYFWNYVELDVKSNDTISVKESIKQTRQNQKIMEEAGLNPLPVFHANTIISSEADEAKKYFNELLEKYEYIFIGGMAGENINTAKLMELCDILFKLNSRYKRKFHALGQSSSDIVLRYPWYSVDSTSWLQGAISNRIFFLKNFIEIKSDKLEKKSFFNNICSPLLFDTEGQATVWKKKIQHNVEIFNEYQYLITELWKLRGIEWN